MNYHMIGFLYKPDVESVRVWEIFGVHVSPPSSGTELSKSSDPRSKSSSSASRIILQYVQHKAETSWTSTQKLILVNADGLI